MEASSSSSCFGFLPTAITNPPFHETPFLHHHHHRFFHCSRFKSAPHPNYRTIYNAVSFPSSSTAVLHHRNDEKGNPLGRRDVGKLVVRWIAQGMRAMASELVESEIHGEFGDLNCSRIHGGIEFVTEAQRFLYAVPMPKGVESACLKASTHYSTLLDHFQRELREVLLQELQISSKKKKPGEIGDEVLEVEDWRKTESWMLLKKLAHSAQHRELARNSSKQKVMHNGLGMELEKAKAIQEKIDIFVKHMSELLQIERNAELDATQKELNAVPVVTEDADAQPMPEYLVTHGQAQEEQCDTICNLLAISFSIGLGGVHLVLFRINGNHRLPPSSVSPGDMVCVRVCDSRGAGATSCMQGFVNKLGEDGCSIIVAFESRHGDPTFSKLVGRTVRIDRIHGLADAVTFERNLEALMLLQREGLNKKNPALAVVATVFGNYDHIKCLEQNNMVKWEEMSGLDSQLSFRGYDESQLKAIALGLNKKRPVLVIQGPPGTGKTGLLKELIVLAVQQGERVLVTAPTNAAVDNIVEKLTDVNINVVRVGNPLRISPVIASKSLGAIVNGKLLGVLEEFERKKADLRRDLRQCLRDDSLAAGIRQLLKQLGKSLKKKEKEIVKEVLSGAQVILCTNTGAADASIRKLDSFDLVVIDEAGQAIEPSCWIPMLQGKRTVLAGDHCQLAPVVLSKKALDGGLGTSLMERASNLHRDVLTTKLTMQYRMNDAIASWASKEMYDGCLVSSQAAAKQLLVDSPFVQATWITMCSLVLLDTRMPYGSLLVGCEEHLDPAGTTSFYNEGEADIVVQHVHSLISSGVSPAEVVIQSPYVAQVQLLRGRIDEVPSISGVEVSTIDSFQGREADAVIISMVRSNTLGAVGFLGDNRRMNVGITRARKHVAVVCDSSTICHDAFLARLLQHIKRFGIVKHVAPSSFGGSRLNMDPMLPSVR